MKNHLTEPGIAPPRVAEEAEVLTEWLRPSDFVDWRPLEPIALVNGAFDLLHTGHLRIIRHARQHAATVVAALDSDRKVAGGKAGRPVMRWIERAAALGYVGVNYIVEIDTDEDMETLMATLRPNFRVQSEEHGGSKRFAVPKVLLRRSGMSTTELIRRCREAAV